MILYRYVSGEVRSKLAKRGQVAALVSKGWMTEDPRKAVTEETPKAPPKKRGRPRKADAK